MAAIWPLYADSAIFMPYSRGSQDQQGLSTARGIEFVAKRLTGSFRGAIKRWEPYGDQTSGKSHTARHTQGQVAIEAGCHLPLGMSCPYRSSLSRPVEAGTAGLTDTRTPDNTHAFWLGAK